MLSCKIISGQGTEEYGNIEKAMLPGLSGQIQILPGHAETFLLFTKGDITLIQKGSMHSKVVSVDGGACHVLGDVISIVL